MLMLPFYGKIAVILLPLVLLPGIGAAIYFRAIQKNESKMMASIAMTIIPCIPLFMMLVSAGNQKNQNEITAGIQSRGGTIISIEKVSSDNTPFKAVRKKFGDHFKIQYSLNGEIHTAWFRGEKGIIQSPQPSFNDKWIFK